MFSVEVLEVDFKKTPQLQGIFVLTVSLLAQVASSPKRAWAWFCCEFLGCSWSCSVKRIKVTDLFCLLLFQGICSSITHYSYSSNVCNDISNAVFSYKSNELMKLTLLVYQGI